MFQPEVSWLCSPFYSCLSSLEPSHQVPGRSLVGTRLCSVYMLSEPSPLPDEGRCCFPRNCSWDAETVGWSIATKQQLLQLPAPSSPGSMVDTPLSLRPQTLGLRSHRRCMLPCAEGPWAQQELQLLSPSLPRKSIHSHQIKKKKKTPKTGRTLTPGHGSCLKKKALWQWVSIIEERFVCVCWYSHPSKWLISWLSHSFYTLVLKGGNLIIPRRLKDFSSHPPFLCSWFVWVIFKVLHSQGYFEQNIRTAVALHTRATASASLGNLEMQILWPHSSLIESFS